MEYSNEKYAADKKMVMWVYNRHFKRNYFLREDLIQIGLIRLWQAEKSYDKSKGSYLNFAYRVIKNSMLSYLRKFNNTPRSISLYTELESGELLIDTIPEKEQNILDKISLFNSVSKLCQDMYTFLDNDLDIQIYKQFLIGCSITQIAKFTCLHRSTVSRRLCRIKKVIKDFAKEEFLNV